MKITSAVCGEIEARLKAIPERWDGKQAILDMKGSGNRQWRQMEWIGFYFQYLCERTLGDIFEFQTPTYGNASFDGLYQNQIPFDFKAHAMNTSSHTIIVNDSEAISLAIEEYGCVGVIIALGEVIYNDRDRTFQTWHENLKGSISEYTKQRIARGAWSRLRKCSLTLSQISILEITDETLVKCGSFQDGFRNSDGSPRRPKLTLNLEKMDKEIAHYMNFGER